MGVGILQICIANNNDFKQNRKVNPLENFYIF